MTGFLSGSIMLARNWMRVVSSVGTRIVWYVAARSCLYSGMISRQCAQRFGSPFFVLGSMK